jgi:GNAT superfamily N-acetyltransferase
VIVVRPAAPADVPAMSRVLTASITELCAADHRDDPALVKRWVANKTIPGVEQMMANEVVTLFVAESEGAVAAVGAIIEPDTIGLNYVDPAHRFGGVSKALLVAMEGELRKRGVRVGKLESTETAHRFYQDAGWQDAGPRTAQFGIASYPMRKALA